MFLKHRLSTADGQKPELRDVRQRIRSCFSELGCFLMPYPGEKVAATNTFDGRQSDLSRDFRDELMKLARSLLAPDRLLVKMVNGTVITCGNLLKLAEVTLALAYDIKGNILVIGRNFFPDTVKISISIAILYLRYKNDFYLKCEWISQRIHCILFNQLASESIL